MLGSRISVIPVSRLSIEPSWRVPMIQIPATSISVLCATVSNSFDYRQYPSNYNHRAHDRPYSTRYPNTDVRRAEEEDEVKPKAGARYDEKGHDGCFEQPYAKVVECLHETFSQAARAIGSISAGSSPGVRDELIRCDTGTLFSMSSAAGTNISLPADPSSQARNWSGRSNTGMRSCTSRTRAFGSVMTIAHECNSLPPCSGSRQRSQMPATVRIGEPSLAVK